MNKVGLKELGNCEDLTLVEAKKFDCCKDLTEDEIKELLEVLKVFTEISFAVFQKKKSQAIKEKNMDYNIAA